MTPGGWRLIRIHSVTFTFGWLKFCSYRGRVWEPTFAWIFSHFKFLFTHSLAFHYGMPFKIYVSKYVIDVLHSLGITCKSEDVMPGKWHVHCFSECVRFRSLTFPYWSCVHASWQCSPSQMPVKPSCFHYFFVFMININRVIVKMGTVERKCPPKQLQWIRLTWEAEFLLGFSCRDVQPIIRSWPSQEMTCWCIIFILCNTKVVFFSCRP